MLDDKPTFNYFSYDDFKCKETGENKIDVSFIYRLDRLRALCGFPLVISSGYRSPKHSAEVSKPVGSVGQHTLGIAADIACTNSVQRYKILDNAFDMGFTGIGMSKDFIHLDDRVTGVPVVWTY